MSDYIEEPLYFEILRNMPIACVDVAIVADGAVLLVKRKDQPARGLWWLPGGRVLKGELMRDTALRKAKEEVGLDCNVGPIIHTSETIFPNGPGEIPVHSINSCFFVYPKSEDYATILDDHHEEVRWVNSIPNDAHPYVVDCLIGAGLGR